LGWAVKYFPAQNQVGGCVFKHFQQEACGPAVLRKAYFRCWVFPHYRAHVVGSDKSTQHSLAEASDQTATQKPKHYNNKYYTHFQDFLTKNKNINIIIL